jgi:hypothetical protein
LGPRRPAMRVDSPTIRRLAGGVKINGQLYELLAQLSKVRLPALRDNSGTYSRLAASSLVIWTTRRRPPCKRLRMRIAWNDWR